MDLVGSASSNNKSLSDELLDALAEFSTDRAVIALDPTGHIKSWSAAATQLFLYEPDEIIGRPYNVLRTLEEDAHKELERVTLQGRQEQYCELLRKDGSRFPAREALAPLQSEPGFIYLVEDVTKPVDAFQEGRLRAERRLELALAVSGVGVWEWEVATNSLYLSPECRTILNGRAITDMESFLEQVHPQDRHAIAEIIEQAFATCADFSLEFRIGQDHEPAKWLYSVGRVDCSSPNVPLRVIGTVIDITERKLAEETAQRHKELLQQMSSAKDQVFWVVELTTGTTLYLGNAFENVWGRPIQHAHEDPLIWLKAVHPEDRPRIEKIFNEWFENPQGDFDEVYRIVRPNGQIRWISDRGTVVRDSQGNAFRLTGIARDITEVRLAKQAAWEGEKKFQQLAERLPLLVWTANPDGFCDYLSPQWVDYTGIPAESLLGFGWLNEVHPDDRSSLNDFWKRVLASDAPYDVQFRIRRFDGTYRWFKTRATPLTDEQGNVVKWFGTNTDIDEQKRTELELRMEQQKFHRITATVPGVICAFRLAADGTMSFPFATPKIHEIYALKPEDIANDATPAFKLIHPDDVDGLIASIEESARTMKMWQYEFRVLNPEKGELWVEGRSIPVKEADGGIRWYGFVWDITDRKLARAELEKKRAELELIFDTVPAIICYKDPQHHLVRVNNQMLRFVGMPRHVVEGRSEKEIGFPNYQQFYDDDDEVMRTGVAKRGIIEPVQTAAGLRWIQTDKLPHRNEHGEIIGIICFSVDITERKLAEDNLRAAEETFRLLLEGASGHSIFMLDPEGKIQTWNSGAERIDGYLAEEIIGRNYDVLFTPEDVAAGKPRALLETARSEGKAEEEGWRCRKDGSLYWANGTLTALYDSESRLRGFAKVTRDLTKRKQAEVFLQSVLNNTIDGIISVDQRGIITTFNQAAERIFGYSKDEVIGQNVRMLMTDRDAKAHDEHIQTYLQTGIAKVIGTSRAVEGRRKDGSEFPVELSVTEFTIDSNRYFTGIIRDMSEKRKLEEQLRQAQKMEAVGQLAGGIAHDFNNMLTVISGYSQILLSSLDDEDPLRDSVKPIFEAGERAASLTRQLLAFSRQSVLEPKILDLNAEIQHLEKMLRRLIGEDVILSSSLDPNIDPILVDPGQLSQVIINIAVNARDAMPKGGKLTIGTRNVELDAEYVSTHAEIRPGRYVMLTISDTGVGMPASIKSRIFDPFFTTKGVGHGTGLGLAVVHGIVKQSGGDIDVYSEPGVGTTFKVYLPAVRSKEEKLSVALDEAKVYGNETVLIVEDEESVRHLATLILQSHGYQVLSATDGEDALHVLEGFEGTIDVLVTDVVMPNMDGRDLAERLRKMIPDLKVLYVSGYTDDAVVRHGLLQKEVAFLQKPYSSVSLTRKVRQVLDS